VNAVEKKIEDELPFKRIERFGKEPRFFKPENVGKCKIPGPGAYHPQINQTYDIEHGEAPQENLQDEAIASPPRLTDLNKKAKILLQPDPISLPLSTDAFVKPRARAPAHPAIISPRVDDKSAQPAALPLRVSINSTVLPEPLKTAIAPPHAPTMSSVFASKVNF